MVPIVGTATYQWFRDGSSIVGGTNILLYLPTTTMADAGVYSLVISNSAGLSTYTNLDVAAGNHDRVTTVSFRPEFDGFTTSSGMALTGAAAIVGRELQLVPARPEQIGSAWFPMPLFCRNGFSSRFQFRIPETAGGGGDGFSFSLQTAGPGELVGADGAGVAITFDTSKKVEESSTNKVRVHGPGVAPKAVDVSPYRVYVEDGRTHTVEIWHEGLSLNVSLDGLVVLKDVPAPLAGALDDAGNAWVGFGAHSGTSNSEDMRITDWSFTPRAELSLAEAAVPSADAPRVEVTANPISGEVHPGQTAWLMARVTTGFDRWHFHPAAGVTVPVDPRIGDGNLRYQWGFRGMNLAGETNATLQMPNFQEEQAGEYSVAVFNHARLDTEDVLAPASRTLTVWQGWPVPGLVEAEDFDEGNNGTAYLDTDAQNSGGAYRVTGVDIAPSTAPDGYKVNAIATGEWLRYTLQVASNGLYRVEPRFLLVTATNATFHVQFGNDPTVHLRAVPWNGYWNNSIGRSRLVRLAAGRQTMRLTFDMAGLDFDAFHVVAVDPATNQPPVISVGPVDNAPLVGGLDIPLTITVADDEGSVTNVEYFVNGMSVGSSATSPFIVNWSSGPAGTYLLTARATGDFKGSSVSPPYALTLPGFGAGVFKREIYANIPGVTLADLIQDPKFPLAPDLVDTVGQFELPPNWGENYGARLSGFLLPPVDGNYTFYLAADDQAALYLSTDENPEHKIQIAAEPIRNGYRQYVNGVNRGNPPANISAPIPLLSGHAYYVEALLKEGTGADFLSVAWTPPGGQPVINNAMPMASFMAIKSDLTVPFPSQCAPEPAGLVGWWRAEGDTSDATGNSAAGVGQNVSFAPGRVGQAFDFRRTGKVTVDAPIESSLNLSNAFTLEAWVLHRSLGSGLQSYVYFPLARAGIGIGNSRFTFIARIGGKLFGVPNSSAIATAGFFYHVTGTFDGQQLRLFINGQLAGSMSAPGLLDGPRNASEKMMVIGSGQGPMDGLIDEVSVYNRALSAQEIGDLFMARASGKCNQPLTLLTTEGSLKFLDSEFLLKVAGDPGPFVLQSSADLRFWASIQTNLLGSEPFTFRDRNADRSESRFYRAVRP